MRIIYNDDGLASSGAAVNEIEGLENAGDIVNDAVFQRNIKVEERLNIEFELIANKLQAAAHTTAVQKVILAGDDLYDIICGVQYRHAIHALEGLYYDLTDAPYLDYTQPWWQDSYMDTISIHDDVRYLLMGDISMSMISNMSAMFYNRNLYEDNFGDPDDLYDTVLNGKWTMDAMRKLVADVYQDVNGDTIANPGDIFGTGITNSSPTEHFFYCMGFKVTGRDKGGYPQLLADQSRNVEIAEALYELMWETEGVYFAKDVNEINSVIPEEFSNGNTLFFPARLSYATTKLRDMKDDYGIIPHPKLNEEQKDYVTLVHDAANAYVIPVTCPEIDAACAALEAMCAENYRTVTPAYYEVALKVKYTRDDLSAQILDLIRNGASTDFMYVNNYVFSGVTLGTISRVLAGNTGKEPTADYMSTYDSMKTTVEAQLKDIIDEQKALIG
ncbi:MAG: hypothetical protein IJF67_14120 [Clostridia bacterium]|nr:hypothetical protein [Clostridia bacterium]